MTRLGATARWSLAGGLLLAVVVVAACIGPYPATPGDVASVVLSRLSGQESPVAPGLAVAIWDVRLPRVLAALAVGAALAAGGTAYQGLFRNPLVSPDILGVSTGAGLGAVVGIFLSLPVLAIQGLSFLGGLLVVAAVYGLATVVRRQDPMLVLVLAGIALSSLVGAVISLLKVLADPYDKLPAITFWLLGSLASVTGGDVLTLLPAVVLGILPLWLLRWRMNLMALGEEEARALGVETGRVRPVVVCGATLATAAAVSVSGVVGWIGLVVPHVARLLVGPDMRRLLPASLLLGGGYLVAVDLLARTIGRVEVPLGILTATLGAPFFVYLLATQRRGWA